MQIFPQVWKYTSKRIRKCTTCNPCLYFDWCWMLSLLCTYLKCPSSSCDEDSNKNASSFVVSESLNLRTLLKAFARFTTLKIFSPTIVVVRTFTCDTSTSHRERGNFLLSFMQERSDSKKKVVKKPLESLFMIPHTHETETSEF